MNCPIRAIVVNSVVNSNQRPVQRLSLQEVPAPIALPHEAIVQVAAISLNRGEIRRSQSAAVGWRPGWDFAGTILVAAQDGSGLPVGRRVVGFLVEGAWAEQVAVSTDAIAAIPDEMTFATAATLPVAGLTALLCLQRGGLLLNRKVLITGASGGVGYFACQMAAAAGAIVTAQVRRSELVEFVKGAKADQVIVGNDFAQYGPYDLVLDSVGGDGFSGILENLALDGQCVTFGATAGPEVTINMSKFYGKGGLNLYGFILFHELKKQSVAAGLAQLVDLVSQGILVPHIDLEDSWENIAEVAQKLTDRKFIGKAVLAVKNASGD